ncbi:MAG TPA: hypothetical protein VF990_05335 [Candidatus Dormibacteraeota bacterium]
MKVLNVLFLAASIVALVGCGGTTATTSVSSPTPASATPSATQVDVAGAQRAAMGLFVPDPSGPQGHWVDCSQINGWASCPLSTKVEARLDALRSQGYFGDAPPSGVCAEEYITHTQNGLNNRPEVLSAIAGANGSVTVVIQRAAGLPNLTAVMTIENGAWLASDLSSGTGPSASIFSAKPNC